MLALSFVLFIGFAGILALGSALFLTVQDLKESLMAKFADVAQAIAQINDATNALAVRVQAIADKVGAGISESEADVIVSELGGVATALTGIAANPDNPIPV